MMSFLIYVFNPKAVWLNRHFIIGEWVTDHIMPAAVIVNYLSMAQMSYILQRAAVKLSRFTAVFNKIRVASQFFTQPFIQAYIKEIIKAPRHGPL